jgi:hypothetical protein
MMFDCNKQQQNVPNNCVITDAFVFLDSEEAHSPMAVSHQSVPVRDPFKQIDQMSNNLAIASEEITVVVQVTA